MTPASPRPCVAVAGAGRLAQAFVPALAAAGWSIRVVWSRTAGPARRLARQARGARAVRNVEELAGVADCYLLAVPDDAVAEVAGRLARAAPGAWRGRVVLHHAGVLGPGALAALERRGARTGVLHPLLVLGPGVDLTRAGGWARLEGDAAALRCARALARALGLQPLVLRGPVSSRRRALYHAAAALAANDASALWLLARRLLERAGAPSDDAERAVLALARSALVRAEAQGLEASLTGPVTRGDTGTLRRHLSVLRTGGRRALEVHRTLSLELLQTARRIGRLGPAAARAVQEELAPAPRRGRRRGPAV